MRRFHISIINKFHSKVVGTTFRKIDWSELEVGDILLPKRDPNGRLTKENHDDPNAIAYFHRGKTGKVQFIGYIPKKTAEGLAAELDDKAININVFITEITGGDKKGNKGINVEIHTQYKNMDYLKKFNPFPLL